MKDKDRRGRPGAHSPAGPDVVERQSTDDPLPGRKCPSLWDAMPCGITTTFLWMSCLLCKNQILN